MAVVGDILHELEAWAPPALAEPWDNVGLLVGGAEEPVERALVALDITPAVCAEAVDKGANLVVSHHPVIFHPLKAVRTAGVSAPAWTLARLGVSAICMHTNLDIAPGGVNDALLEMLGLPGAGILQETGAFSFCKLVVFVPRTHAKAVREAMAEAGAGRLGAYDGCAFESEGKGYFRPLAGAEPYIGAVGRLETVDEVRVEAVCDARTVPAAVAAMKAAHPYEVPAWDVFEDAALREPYGLGRIARLESPAPLRAFALRVKERLHAAGVAVHRAPGAVQPVVHTVAVCSGAWDGELTQAALRAGADTVLTGEIKHSDTLEALAAGLHVVAAGHFATEQPVCAALAGRLARTFPQVSFAVAEASKDTAELV